MDRAVGHTGHVVVVGQMGVGKSTLATGLATALGRRHMDSDVRIEAGHGRTGADIAASDGVDALHRIELAVLVEDLATSPPAVVSAAASVVDTAAGRAALRAPLVVWLDLPVDDLHARIATGAHRRDISPARLRALDAARRPHLQDLADVRLDAALPPDALVDQAVAAITAT